MIETIYIGVIAVCYRDCSLLIPDLIKFIKVNHRKDVNLDILNCEDATDTIIHQILYTVDQANPEPDPFMKTRSEYGLMKLTISTDQTLRYKKLKALEDQMKYYVKYFYENDAGVYFPYLIKEGKNKLFTIPNILICGTIEDIDSDKDDFSYLQENAELVNTHIYSNQLISHIYPDKTAKLLLSSEFGQNS